jgi:hypothetical protein
LAVLRLLGSFKAQRLAYLALCNSSRALASRKFFPPWPLTKRLITPPLPLPPPSLITVRDRQISTGRLTIIRRPLDRGVIQVLVMTAVQAVSRPRLRVVEVTALTVAETAVAAAVEMEDPEVEVRPVRDLPPAGIWEVVETEIQEEAAEVEVQYLPPTGMATPTTGNLIANLIFRWCQRGMVMAKRL